MTFELYDYLSEDGTNEFKAWTEGLQKTQRAKLNEKLDKLAEYGDELYPQLLTDSSETGIQKLRIKAGNVQLRPLLCRGPIATHEEYTLLMGAKEVGSNWEPSGAPAKAKQRKAAVVSSPETRRKTHERIT